MRALFIALLSAPAMATLVFACASSGEGSRPRQDGGASSGSGSSSGACLTCGADGDGAVCQGAHCDAANCSQSATDTTLVGHVYDPAGWLPLYNVYVYIPEAAPAPIVAGRSRLPALRSTRLRLAHPRNVDPGGRFIHAGEERERPAGHPGRQRHPAGPPGRQVAQAAHHPHRGACATNDLDAVFNAGTGTARQLRLPAKSSEGDMPLIAFTSGCDPGRVLPPASRHRRQRVRGLRVAPHPRLFRRRCRAPATSTSTPDATDRTAPAAARWPAATPPATPTPGGATPANLLQYDIVFNACECNPNDRGAGAYAAMDTFLNEGGRLFTTHYYGNWFVPTTATPDLQSVAEWASVMPSPWSGNSPTERARRRGSVLPQGQAYAQWLDVNHISSSPGNITLADLRDDVLAASPAGCSADGSCLSTRWIYNPGDEHPRYLSFNTPVGISGGRAVRARGLQRRAPLGGERRRDLPGGVRRSGHRRPGGARRQREGAGVSVLRPVVVRAGRLAASTGLAARCSGRDARPWRRPPQRSSISP